MCVCYLNPDSSQSPVPQVPDPDPDPAAWVRLEMTSPHWSVCLSVWWIAFGL